ncbi:MAG: CBS domain-containing protein [Anaerolineae bacterium]
MNILDIMSRDVIKVGLKTTVADAINLMQAHHVRHLVVVTADGSLVGIVSDRDLRLASQSPYAVPDVVEADTFAQAILVEQVMTVTPYCVSPQHSVSEVAHQLIEHQISAVPVIHDEILIGIVTSTDLLKVLVAQPL